MENENPRKSLETKSIAVTSSEATSLNRVQTASTDGEKIITCHLIKCGKIYFFLKLHNSLHSTVVFFLIISSTLYICKTLILWGDF